VFANRPGKARKNALIGKYYPNRSEWKWDDSATVAEKWAADTLLKYAHTGICPDVCAIVEAVPCTRCGELLYDPESITKGIGPTCNEKRTKSKAVTVRRSRTVTGGHGSRGRNHARRDARERYPRLLAAYIPC